MAHEDTSIYTCPSCRVDHDDYTPDPTGEYARVCGVCGWKHGAVSLDPALVEGYTRARAAGNSPHNALIAARHRSSIPEPFASWGGWFDGPLSFTDPEGFSIHVEVSEDYDSEPDGMFTDTWSETASDTWAYAPERRHERGAYRYYEREDGGLRDDYRYLRDVSKMGRAEAYETALRYDRETVLDALHYLAACVTVWVSREGVELARASLGGMEYRDYDESMREYVRDEAHMLYLDAVLAAKDTLAALCASIPTEEG